MSLRVDRRLLAVYINVPELEKKRIQNYVEYFLPNKNSYGVADIYGFIYENISEPERYFIQYYGEEFLIQRLWK